MYLPTQSAPSSHTFSARRRGGATAFQSRALLLIERPVADAIVLESGLVFPGELAVDSQCVAARDILVCAWRGRIGWASGLRRQGGSGRHALMPCHCAAQLSLGFMAAISPSKLLDVVSNIISRSPVQSKH